MIKIPEYNFEYQLLEPLLYEASYKNGENIINVLGDCVFCMDYILKIIKKYAGRHSKYDWRYVASGLHIVSTANRRIPRLPLVVLPAVKEDFDIQMLLRHRVKKVRIEAIRYVLTSMLVIYKESRLLKGEPILKEEVKKFVDLIDLDLLFSIPELKNSINSSLIGSIYEKVGYAVNPFDVEKNREFMTKVFNYFWPKVKLPNDLFFDYLQYYFSKSTT